MKIFIIFLSSLLLQLSSFAAECNFISAEKRLMYEQDMNNALNKVLYDKITYNKKTLKNMLIDFNNKTYHISQQPLADRIRNKDKYIKQLDTMFGTISLFPEAICEELQPVINKYDLGIIPGAECDKYLCSNYIKGCNIENYAEFEELIKLKETVSKNINTTRSNLIKEN